MVRVSNWIITGLNIVTMVLACCAIFAAFKLHGNSDSPCSNSLKVPFLVAGGALLVVSFVGMVGACCRVTFFMWIYIIMLIMILMGLVSITIYMIIVANKGFATFFSFGNDGWKDKLKDFSSSLQNYGTHSDHWDKIKSCMDEAKVCKGFEDGKDEQYYKNHMSLIQWGCCTPPEYCGFKLQNATYWIVPESSPALTDRDCNAWSNTQKQLCYDCERCKASFLDDMRKKYRFTNLITFFVIIFVNIVLITACCAKDNNTDHRYQKYRGGYYP